MKPAAFEFVRARTLSEATTVLLEADGAARVVAGAQSLGPMLNLRLVQPRILVDVTGIAELTRNRRSRRCGDARCLHYDGEHRGWPPAGPGPAAPVGRGRAHCLPGGAQPRHHWRQRVPCRSGRGLDLGTLRAWRAMRDRGPRRSSAACGRRLRHRRVRERACARGTAAGDPHSAAFGPWPLGLQQTLPQGRRVRSGDRRRSGRSRTQQFSCGHRRDARPPDHRDGGARDQAHRRHWSGRNRPSLACSIGTASPIGPPAASMPRFLRERSTRQLAHEADPTSL